MSTREDLLCTGERRVYEMWATRQVLWGGGGRWGEGVRVVHKYYLRMSSTP